MALADAILNGRLSEEVVYYSANTGDGVARRMVRHGRRATEDVVTETGRAVRHTEDVSLGTEKGAVAIGDALVFGGLRWMVRAPIDGQTDGLARCVVECMEQLERGKGMGEWRGRLS